MQVAVWFLLVEFVLLLVLWLSLHWVILPHIGQWRPLIETKISQALGVPVRIGSIKARSGGWVPAIEVRDVLLFDAQQRPALRLPVVHVAVSLRSTLASLAALDLRLEQILIEGAQLEVRRDSQGRILVAGLDFSAEEDDNDPKAADWFFKQYEFAIRGGSLRWTDEQRAAPSIRLTGVDVTVRNDLFHHEVRLDATPSAGWGERFSLRGRFTHPLTARSGEWRRWSGQAYADLPRADVGLLRQHVELPFELSQGEGALRVWLGVREGQPRDITLDLALQAVSLRLAAHMEPLVVEQVQGRLTGQRREDGGSLSLQRFAFLTGDGVRWPPSSISLNWTQAPDGAIDGGSISADRLDLDLMAQTATRIPLGSALRQLLSEVNPHGTVNGLSADWQGPFDAPTRYRLNAQLSGLTLAAKPASDVDGVGRPGLRNARIEFSATEKGGDAMLTMAGGSLELPGVFAEAILPLDRLSAKLVWRVEPREHAPPQIEVSVRDATFANSDAQGEVNATWNSGPGDGVAQGGRFPGFLQLEGKLRDGVAARVARYLPLDIPEGARNYLARAVRSGGVSRASFRVKGDLFDFPFLGAEQGEFRIALQAEDVNLAYVPSEPASGARAAYKSPWPALEKLNGEVVIDRASLEIRDASAQLFGVHLNKINGGIPDMAHQPVLSLRGKCKGPMTDMLRFVNEHRSTHGLANGCKMPRPQGAASCNWH